MTALLIRSGFSDRGRRSGRRSVAAAGALESARRAFVDSLFADILGFSACKMIRRILGFAHVIDFDSIVNADLRAGCEAKALAMARMLLTHPEQFQSIDDVIDAVPRIKRSSADTWR